MKKTYLNYQERVIVTTGDSPSTLKKMATQDQLKTFFIPNQIGGRYSVFTVAGLFPIAISGIDIDRFIEGAKAERNCFSESSQYAITRKHLEDVGKVVEAVERQNGVLLITADHGNAEQMVDYKTGEPHTAHTTNPVPLMLIGMENAKLKQGKLADLAPTMLDIMGLEKPEEMTGESLIIK